jgi:hypothetical protein
MLSGFDLRVAAAVHAFQIHAREIGIFLVQIVPLADSARLAGDVRANELLADISHLFFGFARDVKLFILYRFEDSLGLLILSVCRHNSLDFLGNGNGNGNGNVLFYQFFKKMDKLN